jgi:hypothetical protein
LAGWWPASGNASDVVGSNNGTLQNGATATTAGPVGSAFAFDGVDDYVEIPDATALKPTNLTVECWVRFDALDTPGASDPGWLYLVFKKNSQSYNFEGYTLMKTRPPGLGKDVLSFIISSVGHTPAQVNGTTAVVTGQWYHVAGSYDGATAKLYVNGVQEGAQPASFALDYGSRPLFIGTSGESWNGRLAGAVDEVSIYSRALSADEIAAVYSSGSAGKCPPGTGPGTVVWDGGGDGVSWHDPLNWSNDRVPGATNDVRITPATATTVYFQGAQPTVRSLVNQATLWLRGGASGHAVLSVSGDLTNHGTIRLQTVGGGYDDSVTVGGTLANASDGLIEVSPGTGGGRYLAARVVNQGALSIASGTSLYANGAGKVFRQEAGSISATNLFTWADGRFDFVGGSLTGSVAVHNGSLDVATSASASTIVCAGSSTLLANRATNVVVWVQGGLYSHATLTTAQDAVNVGTIRLETSAGGYNSILNVGGSNFINTASGVIESRPGTGGDRSVNGFLVNQGLVDASGHFLNLTGTYEAAGGRILGGGRLVNAQLRVTASSATPTTVDLWGATTLLTDVLPNTELWVHGGAGSLHATLAASGNVTNWGTVRLETSAGGYEDALTVGGVLVNAPGGVIQVNTGTGGGRALTANVVNQGVLNVASGISLYGNGAGKLFRQESGSINAPGLFTWAGGRFDFVGGTLAGSVAVRNGSLDVATTAGASTIICAGASTLLANRGPNVTVWVEGGLYDHATLTTAEGAVNAGTLRLESINGGYTSVVSIGGSNFVNTASGVIEANTGSTGARSISGNFVNQGLVSATNGYLDFYGTYEAAGGRIEGAGRLRSVNVKVTASPAEPTLLDLWGNTTLLTDNLPNTILWVHGGGDSHSTFTLPGTITNRGTLLLESTGGGYWETVAIGGLLVNAPEGTIQVNAGSGGGRELNGNIVNQGAINVASGISLYGNGASKVFRQEAGAINATNLFTWADGRFDFVGGFLTGSVAVRNGSLGVEATAGASTLIAAGNSTLLANRAANVTVWVEGGLYGDATLTTSTNGSLNLGTIRLESTGGGFTSAISAPVPGLTNGPTGMISSKAGASGPRWLSGTFVNQGLVSADNGYYLDCSGNLEEAGGRFEGSVRIRNSWLRVTASPAVPTTMLLWNVNTLATDNRPNVTLLVQGGGSGDATLNWTNGWNNFGTVALDSINGGYAAILNVSNGTLRNRAGGVLEFRPGTGGGRPVNAALNNEGDVLANYGATVSATGANHANLGVIRLANATLTFGGATLTNSPGALLAGVGTFDVSGVTFHNAGRLSPGASAGRLAFTSGFTQSDTAQLDLEIGGPTAATGFDQLVISGSARLAGTVNITLTNGYTPDVSNVFPVVTYSSVAGAFAAFNGLTINSNIVFEPLYKTTQLELRTVASTNLGTNLPSILVQPVSQTVERGNPAQFQVTANGSPPLRYQWRFQGSDLAGETRNAIAFASAETNLTGAYVVVLSNAFGAVTSTVATLTVVVPSQLVHWDGGGDGINWSDPLNWSGDFVPGVTNDVIADVPGLVTITVANNATVASLQSEEALLVSGGTFAVTSGPSWVNGGLTVNASRGLAVQGSNTTLTANGPTVVDGALLTAQNGASLNLPAAFSFTSGRLTLSNNATASLAGVTNVNLTRFLLYAGATFTLPSSVTNYSSSGGMGVNEQRTVILAQGAGTRLDLSSLQGFQAQFSGLGGLLQLITAATGAEIDLSGLSTVTGGGSGANGGGPLEFRTDATGLIRLTGLAQLSGVNAGILVNCARTNWDLPQLTAATLTRFTLPANGVLGAPSLGLLQTCRLTIPNGARVAAPALGQFLNSTLELSGSGVFDHGTLSTVESSRFLLSGGATYVLPAHLQAFVSSAAFGMNESRTLFSATGSGTRLDLSSLTNIEAIFSAWGGLLLRIQATSGGEVDLSGLRKVTGGGSGLNGGGPFEFYTDAASHLRLSALERAEGTGAGLLLSLAGTNELTAAQLTVTNTRVVLASNSVATVGTLLLLTDGELSGSGTIQGSVTNSGEVRPGTSAGRLTVNGNYTQTPAGTLFIEVGGTNAGTHYDQLAVTGNAVLEGMLNLQLINNYAPALTNSFQILPCGARLGQFASVAGTDAGKSVTFIPNYETNAVWLGLTFATGPSVVSAGPNGSLTHTFDQLTLTFSETLAASSFTAADISLTGPAGAVAVNAPQLLSNTTWRISFAAQTLPGDYTLIVGPAVNDLVGNPMNQNGDSVNGQAVEDRFIHTVTVPPPVDFAAVELSAPSAAAVGTPVQIAWTVMNQSTNPAAGPRTDAVYLSTDRVVGSDVLLGEFGVSGALDAGKTRTVTNIVVLPVGTTGTRYFLVVADSSHEWFEISETNNTFISTNATLVSAADLSVTSVSAATNSARFGDALTVTWVVRNGGTVAAGTAWRDRVYLSRTTGLTAQSIALPPDQAGGPLGAGASYTNSATVTLPLDAGWTAGTYYLVVAADVDNTQAEANEANNLANRSLSLTVPPLPDLVVADVRPPAVAIPGVPFAVAWVVTNAGSAPAAGGWSEAVYATEDPASGPAVLLSRFFFTNTLAAGADLTRTQTVSLPATRLAGNVRFSIVVDSEAEAVESVETNNTTYAADLTWVPSTLTLTLPLASVREDTVSPSLTALIERNGSVSNALAVALLSSDTSELAVPATVSIPAGQASATFIATVQWDHVPDPDATVTLTASAVGFTNGVTTLQVVNADWPQLALSPSSAALTEGETLKLTVSRNPATDQPLTVNLASQSAADLVTPSSVIIPAGSNSASFSVAAPADTFIEASRAVTVTASAAGHLGGASLLTVLDDDATPLVLAINPASVMENAGPAAVIGTVYRLVVTSREVAVQLASSDSNTVAVPYLVTIPPNEASASFALEVINDSLLNGSRQVEISAYLTESLTGSRLGAPVTNQLMVLDDDGPAIAFSLARALIPEGSNTLGTVTRNTPATNDLVVTLTSSDLSEATLPAKVTIPSGTNAASFLINAVNDGTPDGTQPATLTASAPNHSPGNAVLQVTDINRPDLMITEVSGPASGFTKENVSLTFRLANLGIAPFTNTIVQRVWLSDDPLPGGDILVGDYTFNPSGESIAAGLSFQQTVSAFLPLRPGYYWVIVSADALGAATEIDEANNLGISAVPIEVVSEYTAMVQTAMTTGLAGSLVPMTGQIYMANGQSPEGKLVNIHVTMGGFKRVIGALAQADGTFAVNFRPLPNEAGVYTIGAAHPGESAAPIQDTFTLLGAAFAPASLGLTMAPDTGIGGQVTLKNLGDAPLSGLQATPVGLPANVNATVTLVTNVLAANGTVAVSYAIGVTGTTPSPATFTLRATSAEGVTVDLPVSVTIRPLQAQLVAQPASLLAGMVIGGQKLVTFELVNQGGATSGPVQVVLPQVPWLAVAGTNPLPALAPGQTNSVTLQLTPPADLALTAYDGQLAVLGGASTLPVPFRFIALSEARGGLEVRVEDENTYYTSGQPGVAGATVRLLDAFSRAVVAEQTSGTNGATLFSNLEEGPYTLQVEAPQHEIFSSPVTVASGLTNLARAFVALQTVAYRWSVVPTEVADRYRMSLETTFEANVPWPVVTVDQPLIVPLVFPGEVTQTEITLTNHGLIAAQGVQLQVRDTATYKITPLVRDIGELPARSSITIPVLVQLQPPIDQQVVDAIRAHTGGGSPSPAKRNSKGWAFGDECEYPEMKAYYFMVCGGDRRWHLVKMDIRPLLAVKELAGCAKSIYGNAPNLLKSPVAGAMGMVCDCLIPAVQKLGEWMGAPVQTKAMECVCAAIGLDIAGMAKCVCYKGGFEAPQPPPGEGGGGTVHINPVVFESGDCLPGLIVPVGSGPLALPQAKRAKDSDSGICAQVRLRLDQDLVLTRNAFRATLEIENRTPDISLTNVSVRLDYFDASGASAAGSFVVIATNLSRITAVDGSGIVLSNTTGTVEFTILPAKEAAPAGATPYLVGGELRYTLGGQQSIIPLSPAPITVLPESSLTVRYFHQRDVFSDDSYTSEVEPAIPYALGMIVQNSGAGTARNVRVTSSQPEIVDNEKGLLIDFQLIASEVAGQNLTPSLTIQLGDIPPGTNAIARWLFTSSLQGLFLDYHATFEHLDGLGHPELSLIDAVEIHEMNHVVLAPFGDALPDFLVNDEPDADDLPDAVYLSDGTVRPVAVVRAATVGAAPGTNDLEVVLGAALPSSGFGYLRVPDPQGAAGARQYRLVAVSRLGGTNLPPENFWQTDRTFIGQGRPPIRENLLHLFDDSSPGQYTLTYVPVATNDISPPTSLMAALPAENYAEIALQWSGQDNAGGSGLAGFDIWVSDNGGPFTRWLERSALTSAFYPGVAGHTYAFYSTAVDVAGNVEPIPGAPDAQTTVSLINTPPTLSLGTDLIADEGQTVLIASSATDTNAGQTVTFSLLSAPPNAVIQPATGWITWPTGESDGPGTNTFVVRAADNGLPQLSATGSVTVVVREVNRAPLLAPVANRTINEGFTLLLPSVAADLDLPPNGLSYHFGSNVPAGASLNATNGLFRWQPTQTQGPSTNAFWIVVTDDGTPMLSATQSFTVVVRDALSDLVLGAGTTNLLAGGAGEVQLALNSTLEVTNLSFVLEADAQRLSNLTVQAGATEVVSAQVTELAAGRLAVSLRLDPALRTAAHRPIATLGFSALTNRGSAIVAVTLSQLQAWYSGGEAAAHTATLSGGVIIVEREPVLLISRPPSPRLTLFGLPGRGYAFLVATNLRAGTVWQEFHRLTLAGLAASLDSTLLPAAPSFFRALEVPGDAPRLELLSLGGNRFALYLQGLPGESYTVQSAPNLAGMIVWSNVTTMVLTNPGAMLYWTNQAESKTFFRARKP